MSVGGSSWALRLRLVLVMKLPISTALMTNHHIPAWTEWKTICGKRASQKISPEKSHTVMRTETPKKTVKATWNPLSLKQSSQHCVIRREGGSLLLGAQGDFLFMWLCFWLCFCCCLGYENMPQCSDKTDCEVTTKQIRVQFTETEKMPNQHDNQSSLIKL